MGSWILDFTPLTAPLVNGDWDIWTRRSGNEMNVLCLLSLLLAAVHAEPQLIGHRGIINLRDGQVYRDEETVRASEAAARFALITERDEQILQRSRKYDSQRFGLFPLPLYASHLPQAAGRPLLQNEIFDVLDSKFVNVFPENEFNKLLNEVEIERATAPTRSFPGDPLPSGHPAPARPPNRLVDLNSPVEPSLRTKNAQSHFGTIYDGAERPVPGSPPLVSSLHPASPRGPGAITIDRPPVGQDLGPDGPLVPFVHIGEEGPRAVGPGGDPGLAPLQPTFTEPLQSAPILNPSPLPVSPGQKLGQIQGQHQPFVDLGPGPAALQQTFSGPLQSSPLLDHLDQSPTLPVQQFFEPPLQSGPPPPPGSSFPAQEVTGSFVDLGDTGPQQPINTHQSSSTFVDEEPLPLPPRGPPGPGQKAETPFVNLGSGPAPLGPSPGYEQIQQQGKQPFVDLGSSGLAGDVFASVRGVPLDASGLGRGSLSQLWY